MRLNLGCGKRMFADYMNVDIFDYDGDMPYTKADINKLPFEDESADEIFTCHVIEHFWPWDVPDLLKEWKRVLKPGGQIVTECPNLAGTAMLYVEAVRQGDWHTAKAMMNAFYGDPAPHLRHMEQRHKWGYCPETLAAVLYEAGFKDAEQVPAQFKMREPRDMRVVAVKP